MSRQPTADSRKQPTSYHMDKFQQLSVWQKAHALVLRVYSVTKTFPEDERYGLTSQMRRSSASGATNIAEGAERTSIRVRRHFHEMARTSLEELKYQILLAIDLGYINTEAGEILIEQTREVGRMLRGLDRSLLGEPTVNSSQPQATLRRS